MGRRTTPMIVSAFLCFSYLITLAGFSCTDHQQKKPASSPKDEQLLLAYKTEKASAYELIKNNHHMWPLPNDCDGMVWAGKLAAVIPEIDILAAEYPDNPGKFGRRPPIDGKWCWMPDEGDLGSKTEWSRDMAVCGLFQWAWANEKLDVLENHAQYGKDHFWKMGEPLDDGRTLYTPSMIGLLYQIIYALGGEGSTLRHSPDIYPSGLEDYHAHLQVCNIYLRGEIEQRLEEKDLSLSVSGTMLERLIEHAEREPNNPFFLTVLGIYTGDFSQAIDTLLDPEKPVGSYVRCHGAKECEISERLFSMRIILSKLNLL